MTVRYLVRGPGFTAGSFKTAADAAVWALKNVTPLGHAFEIMRIEAEGVH